MKSNAVRKLSLIDKLTNDEVEQIENLFDRVAASAFLEGFGVGSEDALKSYRHGAEMDYLRCKLRLLGFSVNI